MSTTRNTPTVVTPVPKRQGGIPLPPLIIGLALLALWLVATLLQIQTSEAFLLNGPVVSLVPNWGILMQIPDLVQGKLTPDLAKATLWGWGIELVYLMAMVGYELAHEGVSRANHQLASVFQTLSIGIVAFDAYMDFRYGSLASGFWGQVGFAAMTSFIVLFFGLVGLRFIEHAFQQWHK
jgi:hypothetical protein